MSNPIYNIPHTENNFAVNKYLYILVVFVLLCVNVSSQTTVNGYIIDERHEPVIGAAVSIKSTSVGSITNTDGYFSLLVSEKLPTTLSVGLLGYVQQEVQVRKYDKPITITLVENINVLGEVVVTALGIHRDKATLPYATQRISSEDLNRVPVTSVASSLSGKIAGLQITSSNTLGGTNNVILRGFKSLTQSNQVLFIVDGVPIDNSNLSTNGLDLGNAIADINPDDIESINVLKGAAASALYGSRAVNGVIVINTKKGSKHSKLSISVNQGIRLGVADSNTLPKYQTSYGQGKGSYGNNTTDPWFYYQPVFNSDGNPARIVITNQDLAWGPAYDSNTSVYTWESFVPGGGNFGKATPWVAAKDNSASEYFESPISTNTSIYINGGTEKSTYKVGYSYDKTNGIVPNSSMIKNSFNFGWSQELIKNITLETSLNYSRTKANNRSAYDYRSSNTNVRDLRQWFPSNISYKAQKDAYNRGYNASWNTQAGSYNVYPEDVIKAAYHNNVYWNDYENYNNDARSRYFGNVSLTYKIIDNLKLLGRVSQDSYNQLFEDRVAVGSVSTAKYYRSNTEYRENNYDLLLDYNKNITEKLKLTALLGGTVRRTNLNSITASTSGGLVVPGLYALSNSKEQVSAPVEFAGKKQVNSAFAGANVVYNDLVTFDITGRWDQSSTLPKHNNSYFYPAVSGGFIFSTLLKELTWLSFGKLRLNYAQVGSDAPFYSVNNNHVAGSPFNGQSVFSVSSINNNPDLKPERNRSYEVGVEGGLLDNRINFDITYYQSRLYDQILPVSVSSASGYSGFYVNGGTIQNRGVEVSINVNPIRTKDFNYDFTINWSKNDNKVISLYGNQPSYTIAQYHNSVQLVAEVGQPYGILRGRDYEYLDGQRLVDENGLYVKKAANDNANLGKVTPDWIGGITNRFNYKDFTFSFLIDISKGGNIYSLDMDNGSRSGILAHTAGSNDLGNPLRNPLSEGGGIILPGVKADGSANDIRIDVSDAQKLGNRLPFGSTNALTAKSYVYDASYVKLREVALSYSLPKKLFPNTSFVKGITLTLSGRNLWIIHKNLPYSDPEQGSPSTTLSASDPIVYNANASIGYQNAVYPSVREFAFNAKINF